MTKEKFFEWLDEQIRVFEQVKEIVEATDEFITSQAVVKNIEFQMSRNNEIQLNNLWQAAKILDIQLDFKPIEHETYAGKSFLSHKGYTFIDYVRKDEM